MFIASANGQFPYFLRLNLDARSMESRLGHQQDTALPRLRTFAVLLGHILKTGRDVHGVAYGGVIQLPITTHVSHYGGPRMQPDSQGGTPKTSGGELVIELLQIRQ